jgi:hypothetical protein
VKPAQTYVLEFPLITDAEESDEDDGVEYDSMDRMGNVSGMFLPPRGGPLWYGDRYIECLQIRKIEPGTILLLC